MNYQKIYDALIQKRKFTEILTKTQIQDTDFCYTELHHIVPVCQGGTNDSSNKVRLLAREHYIAHLLLRKIYPDDLVLNLAVELMRISSSLNPRKFKINNRLFQKIKTQNAVLKSKLMCSKVWIKNLAQGVETLWDKTLPLTDEMVNNGWEYGRLPMKHAANRTYENVGYERGKWVRVTNDVEDWYQLATDPIPEGCHRGMSKQHKENQSKGMRGKKGTTTGKTAVYSITTGHIKYVNKDEPIPEGYTKTRSHKEQLKSRQLGEAKRGRKFCTDGKISFLLKHGETPPPGFYYGQTKRTKK